jgi:membrane dipeptidase
MNRVGMFVDISHVSPETMDDVLRVSKAPVIASHSGAYGVANHPRNVPDAILKRLPQNGGVVMVVFYPSFIVPDRAKAFAEARVELKKKFPIEAEFDKAYDQWVKDHPMARGSAKDIADHIDHIVKVAGIDHVGIGSDYDGISDTPLGMEDVSCYPRLTEELIARGYSDDDIRKILGGNVIRALRQAGKVADELRKTVPPEVDQLKTEKD